MPFRSLQVLDHSGGIAQTQIGTPFCLSPEICQDKPYGRKSDVWALGVILHELFALQVNPRIKGRISNVSRSVVREVCAVEGFAMNAARVRHAASARAGALFLSTYFSPFSHSTVIPFFL